MKKIAVSFYSIALLICFLILGLKSYQDSSNLRTVVFAFFKPLFRKEQEKR